MPLKPVTRVDIKIEDVEGLQDALDAAGGGGGAINGIFYENYKIVDANYTITSGKNAMTAGPIEIADGVEVTVPDGSTWTIV